MIYDHAAFSYEPVTIVIPAYNEESGIEAVIFQIHEVLGLRGIPYELIVVDDGSSDNTALIAQHSGARVVRHVTNRGYGASLKTGIVAARNDVIVISDADGTYPVSRIPEMLQELTQADLVVGARVGTTVKIPLIRRPGKWLLRRLAEYIVGEPIADLNSGLRAFRHSVMQQYLPILPNKFSFTTTQTMAMLCDGYKLTNIPIDYYQRKGKSKIVAWDFVNFISLVLRISMLFDPLKVFVPVALSFLLLGIVKFVLDILIAVERQGGLTWAIITSPTISTTTLMLVLAGIQILLIGMMSDGLARKIGQHMPKFNMSYINRELKIEERTSNDTAKTSTPKG